MQKKHQQHRNQIRIIGGIHRGRKLSFPPAQDLRPTADSVRERLFNWLGQDLTGHTVLDLFAGSGAMGLEAASRQAEKIVMVEKNRQVVNALRKSIDELQLRQVDLIYTDAMAYLNTQSDLFDLVFLDPPYVWDEQQWSDLLARLVDHLKPDARIYLEARKIPPLADYWQVEKQGKSGISQFRLLSYQIDRYKEMKSDSDGKK
ncbi:16S rRNA (guanine(966)-N(2))-methyltransferase RsmD [Neisseriaceae bacterium ESL0693]|nr:16S rRNA (guanine(966)-N(2))-methyltransferase RsmD [Neisseriaceae bacterium ESL0693]